MKRVRMFALLWLAMAAAMLPAGARPVSAATHRPTGQETPGRHEPARRERGNPADRALPTNNPTESILVAAPVCDVWDGYAARMVSGRPECSRNQLHVDFHGPAQAAGAVLAATLAAGFGEPGFAMDLASLNAIDPSSGRLWFSCLRAHAPPMVL